MGERPAHIVILPAARPDQLLEFRDNPRVTPAPAVVDADTVVNLRASVEGQDDIRHFAVGEVDYIVVNQYAVGRERKAETLPARLLHASGVLHKPLDNVPIHQRFAAEEVYF